ncbi:MAG: ferrous iron transport protein B [Polyangiaceae bacterium]
MATRSDPSSNVYLAGNPNAGKTTLFNALTGARAKVGNYPGVTVERRTAKLALGDTSVTVIDLPGSYSLSARSEDERVAVDALFDDPDARAVIVVADATTLRRGLYFATQLLELGLPTVVALSMMDEARSRGIRVDPERLGKALGCEVVPVVAPRGEGRAELCEAIGRALSAKETRATFEIKLSPQASHAVDEVARKMAQLVQPGGGDPSARTRLRATLALLSLGDDDLTDVPQAIRDAVGVELRAAEDEGRDLAEELVSARYAFVDRVLDETSRTPAPADEPRRLSRRIDDVLLHPVWGLSIFAIVMFVVFQSLFAWAEPLVGLIESAIAASKAAVAGALPPGPFTDLLTDGVIAGVGNVVVFVPQIAILFIFLTILEDSGYLARVAFVIDRVMAKVGLNGRAFVPMLSGFSCAIPAVMATRTIESRRDRLLTMLVVPLSSCSARLPVYVLVTSVIFDRSAKVFGVLSMGALVLFAMYALSVFAALFAAFVIGRTVLKGPRPTLLLELPPYRLPAARNVGLATWQRVRRFLVDAGTVILALTVVLWAMLHYPNDPAVTARYDGLRAEAAAIEDEEARSARLEELDHEQQGERLRGSIAGHIGRAMEPAIRPLGFDWKIGIGILGAFAAREVFVSTLGLVYDVGEADEASEGLQASLRQARHPDGSPVFTPLAGVSLMVFFVLACQCMSTLAVVRRESGSWKWPGFMLGYMTALAYTVTLLVYQGGRALGLG